MPINRWGHRLNLGDVFHDDDLTFEAKRDEIVCRIKAARWYDEDDTTLWSLVDELADTEHIDEFDVVWDHLYDWFDAERVWVVTWPESARA